MKEKILFVLGTLKSGGAEKSLISLLSIIDYEKYDVDLLLFQQTGVFMSLIPKEVNLLPVPKTIDFLSSPFTLKNILKKGSPKTLIIRIKTFIYFKIQNKIPPKRKMQLYWQWWANVIKVQDETYLTAIGYLQTLPIYYIVEKVHAKHKIGWFHSDYKAGKYDPDFDRPYFEKLDRLIAVSDTTKEILWEVFPEFQSKIMTICNVLPVDLINTMAYQGIGFTDDFGGIRILSIGRLSPEKGFDLAVEACSQIIREGYNIKWHVFGTGPEKEKLKKQIKAHNLETVFVLEGENSNVYPFLKQADIFVQPSRFEGKSIAVDEAKLFCKPIITTNYDTARDQITDTVNGLIVEMTSGSIASAIIRLINEPTLREDFILNLKHSTYSCENDQKQINAILSGEI